MREVVKKSLMINSVLLFTDIAAGMVLYNYGKSAASSVSFKVPPRKELWNMVGVAAVTSVLTALAITKIENMLKIEIFDPTDGAYITESWDELIGFLGLEGSYGEGEALEPAYKNLQISKKPKARKVW